MHSSFFSKQKFLSRLTLLFLLCLLGSAFTGCAAVDKTLAWFGFGTTNSGPETPESLAMQGMDEFNQGNYRSALKIFEDIKDRYPFSNVGLLAELKAADSNFYLKNYAEALALYKEFEENHPTNEAIPYVLFQMGMSYYEQIDTIDRDTEGAAKAIDAFSRLIRGFPHSPYVQEARARVRAARDFLARHEMYVATFYVKTEEYKEAEGRLEYLLRVYPQSTVAPKAKELLAALKSGNPPKRTWRSWLPDISLPSWKSFMGSISPMPGGGAAPAGGGGGK